MYMKIGYYIYFLFAFIRSLELYESTSVVTFLLGFIVFCCLLFTYNLQELLDVYKNDKFLLLN